MKGKMSILAGLFLAVIVTGYSVSGTYARYTTTLDAISDSARVAKWSIGLDDTVSTTVNLFEKSYNNDAVLSDTNVVAPGTSGEYEFALKATVETNYTISIDATITNDVKVGDYSPIKFSVDGGTNWIESSALEAAIEGLYTGKVYGPTSTQPTQKIMWKWEMDNGHDADDTTLGKDIVAGTNHGVEVKFVITATQSADAANS